MLLILYGSLYPWNFESRQVAGGAVGFLLHRWDSWRNGYLIRDIFVNVVLYIPLGLAGTLAFPKRWPFAPFLFALALSVSVELAQVYEPARESSMVDVLCNTGGAAIGAALAMLSRRVGRRFADPGALVLAAGCFASLLFPLVPVHGRAVSKQSTASFVHSPLVSAMPLATALAIWYASGLLLRETGVKFPRLWLALSLLTIPLQTPLIHRTPLLWELTGATAGVVLFALRPRTVRVTRWEAWGFLLFTAIGPLWPFHFNSQAGRFSFVPFEGLIIADGPTSLWIILSQFVAWGTAIWLFWSSGTRRWPGICLVAGVVTAAQLARIFVPNATPGVTAPLLALIAGYVLNAIED